MRYLRGAAWGVSALLVTTACGRSLENPSTEAGVPLSCGDGVLDPGEECDDGNREPLDGCHFDCRLPGSILWQVQPQADQMWVSSIAADDRGSVYLGGGIESQCYIRRVGDNGTVAWTIEAEPAPDPPPEIPDLYGGVIRWSAALDAAILGWWRDSYSYPFDPFTGRVAAMRGDGELLWMTTHVGMSIYDVAADPQGRVAIVGAHDWDDPQWPEPSIKILDGAVGADLVDLSRPEFAQGDAGRAAVYASSGVLFVALAYDDNVAYILRIQPDGTVDREAPASCPGWGHLHLLPDDRLLLASMAPNDTIVHL